MAVTSPTVHLTRTLYVVPHNHIHTTMIYPSTSKISLLARTSVVLRKSPHVSQCLNPQSNIATSRLDAPEIERFKSGKNNQ